MKKSINNDFFHKLFTHIKTKKMTGRLEREICYPHCFTFTMYIFSVIVVLLTIPIIIAYTVKSNNYVFTLPPTNSKTCLAVYIPEEYLTHEIKCELVIDPLPLPDAPACINIKNKISLNNVTACYTNQAPCCRKGFNCDHRPITQTNHSECDQESESHRAYVYGLDAIYDHGCVCKDTVTDNICTMKAYMAIANVLNLIETDTNKVHVVYEPTAFTQILNNTIYPCYLTDDQIQVDTGYYKCKSDYETNQQSWYWYNVVATSGFLGAWMGALCLTVIFFAMTNKKYIPVN
jgi:hypothetical protein